MPGRSPSPLLVFFVLFLVYIGWGSSYIGYKLSLEVAGPFLVAGGRTFFGGLLLAVFLLVTGRWRHPSLASLCWYFLLGIPMVLFGSGFIGLGQTQVSSSVAAIVTSTTPIIMLVSGCLFAGEPRPTLLQSLGLCTGSLCIAYLGYCQQDSGVGPHPVIGMITVLLAAVGWVAGSLIMKRHPLKQQLPALQGSSLLLLCGGLDCFVVGVLMGEPWAMHPENIRPDVIIAFSWMTIGGSLIAYSCYLWLLTHVSIAVAVSYEYVVPVVGIVLGWRFGGEAITQDIIIACGVIIASVALVVVHRTAGAPALQHRSALDRWRRGRSRRQEHGKK